jgi:hypothetical protein
MEITQLTSIGVYINWKFIDINNLLISQTHRYTNMNCTEKRFVWKLRFNKPRMCLYLLR